MSDVEHQILATSIADAAAFEAQMKKMFDEGWRTLPEFPPVVIYHLVRDKKPEPISDPGLQGRLLIDESKIGILRNGKII